MKRIALTIALSVLPTPMLAELESPVIDDIVATHILPRFETLAEQTQTLWDVAAQDCDPTSTALRSAYGDAFDAWVSASHLRFGPTEVDDRAFALAFWPDSRGATPRALNSLIADQDPIASSAADYEQVSIAARGFYAMEFLLYDDDLMAAGPQSYHCNLIQTISADSAVTSQDIFDEWQYEHANEMLLREPDGIYRSNDEALQEIFKALSTGLQFNAETRLGRPLGTFDRPRPTRAEVRRSGRSSQHVMLSLMALQDLAAKLAGDDPALAGSIDARFERALSQLFDLNDPTFASVSEPHTRIKVEIVQQSTEAIRAIVRDQLGPKLGVAVGFNALDGD